MPIEGQFNAHGLPGRLVTNPTWVMRVYDSIKRENSDWHGGFDTIKEDAVEWLIGYVRGVLPGDIEKHLRRYGLLVEWVSEKDGKLDRVIAFYTGSQWRTRRPLEIHEIKVAKAMAPSPDVGEQYRVIVSNIGTVYEGSSISEASGVYEEYIELSSARFGRASGEVVTWFADGDILAEYLGGGSK